MVVQEKAVYSEYQMNLLKKIAASEERFNKLLERWYKEATRLIIQNYSDDKRELVVRILEAEERFNNTLQAWYVNASVVLEEAGRVR